LLHPVNAQIGLLEEDGKREIYRILGDSMYAKRAASPERRSMLYATAEVLGSLAGVASFGGAPSLSIGAGSIGPGSNDIIDIDAIALKALNPKNSGVHLRIIRMNEILRFSHICLSYWIQCQPLGAIWLNLVRSNS